MKYLTFAIALAIATSFAFSSPASASTCEYVAEQLGQQAYDSCMSSRQDTTPNRIFCKGNGKAKQIWHLNACRAKHAHMKAMNTPERFCERFSYQGYKVNC